MGADTRGRLERHTSEAVLEDPPPTIWESGIEKRAAENGFEQAASRSGLEKRQAPLPARTSARGLEEQGPEDQREKQRTPETDLRSSSY